MRQFFHLKEIHHILAILIRLQIFCHHIPFSLHTLHPLILIILLLHQIQYTLLFQSMNPLVPVPVLHPSLQINMMFLKT